MEAEGKGGWWNQYGSITVDKVIDRAKEANLDFVIVKAGYPLVLEQFLQSGLKVGIEAYVYPDTAGPAGEQLADAIVEGASFAVINAEVEWEGRGSTEMLHLIASFRVAQPNTELYASTDTRGGRTHLPYQRVLAQHVTGWMPMIYPLSFYPNRPAWFVAKSFEDCLESGQQFDGLPVLPTIQTYDNIGSSAVLQEIAECRIRHYKGYQAYTIGHATDEEWTEFKGLVEQEEDMTWLDETISDMSGRPINFEVLNGDSTRRTTLTRKEWITFTALGWIVGDHTHNIPSVTIR